MSNVYDFGMDLFIRLPNTACGSMSSLDRITPVNSPPLPVCVWGVLPLIKKPDLSPNDFHVRLRHLSALANLP